MTARTWRSLGGVLLLVVVLLLATRLGGGDTTTATDTPAARATTSATPTSAPTDDTYTDPESGLPWIDAADLPPEARDVLAAIDAGGPFGYPGKDGSTFGNYEGVLPDEPRGHYHEYTVETPGSDDRGARRIVTGGPREDPTAYFWTDDHYESFSRVRR